MTTPIDLQQFSREVSAVVDCCDCGCLHSLSLFLSLSCQTTRIYILFTIGISEYTLNVDSDSNFNMLRQALDEAENHEKELHQQQQQPFRAEDSGTERLIPSSVQQDDESGTINPNYGSTSSSRKRNSLRNFERNTDYDFEEDDDDDDDDDDDYSSDQDEYWENDRSSLTETWRRRSSEIVVSGWSLFKGCLTVVLNVEDVWDSPTTSQGREIRRRNHYVILFWFFILAISYTTERVSFKLLVDRSGPFRLLAVEAVAFVHALLLGGGMLASAISRKDMSMQPLGIPLVDVGLMALLDTLHMLLVFLTGYHVPPTLTVILVQFTLPLTALISQAIHPDGYCNTSYGQHFNSNNSNSNHNSGGGSPMAGYGYSPRDSSSTVGQPMPGSGGLSIEHVSGSIIISLAVLLALCPFIYTLIDEDFFQYASTANEIPKQTALNTILFLLSCVPAAASQLYKEYIFHQYKQPVQPDYLNFLLSAFQVVFASIMSPLLYVLLGFAAADDWTDLYPTSDYSKSFGQGVQCFFGILDQEAAKHEYYDEASCHNLYLLILLYAFSVICVGVAVDKIVIGGGTLF